MNRRAAIGAALVLPLLLAACGDESTPVANPPATSTAASVGSLPSTTTLIVEPAPPPPAPPKPPKVPANLPDEFLMLTDGRLVALDGSSLGRIRGFHPYYGFGAGQAFGRPHQIWTFRDGRVVRAKPLRYNLRVPGAGGSCQRLARVPAGTLFSCDGRNTGRVLVRAPDGEVRRFAPPAGKRVPGGFGGSWALAFPSPDGSRLLLGWSGECEVQTAFFVPIDGGEPEEVTGEETLADAPESIALGWSADGRALVVFPEGVCSSGLSEPGVYALDSSGGRTLIARATSAAFFHG